MSDTQFLFDGTDDVAMTVLLAHGAGAAMDHPVMTAIAQGLAVHGIRVARFEFAYMAGRRDGGSKRPPPKIDLLQQEYHAAIAALGCSGPLVIAGKSMGGRVASLIADDLFAAGRIAGLLCFGYPFHPRGKPETLRIAHLATLQAPTLICHGSRDPFGTREEVANYPLSDRITLSWAEDGDHDLKPRKRVSGVDHATQLQKSCAEAAGWLKAL